MKKVACPLFLFCPRYEEGAAAIILVIVVIIALLTLIGGLVLLTSTGYKSYHFSKNRAQALYLAEAGISSAIQEIKDDEDHDEDGVVGSISDATLAYSDNSLAGFYSVECVLGGSSYTLTSTGIVNKGSTNEVERTVEVTVEVTVESGSTVFDMAAFAGNDDGNGITIDKGVSIDSYDSEGTGQLYVEAEAGNKGDIGTNSISTSPKAVDIDRDSHISGDVYIGQEGEDVLKEAIDNRGIVDGELRSLDENKNLPEVDPPSPSDFGLSSQDSEGPLVVEEEKGVSSNGWYDSITVKKNGHLTFNPDVTFIYVDGNMSITGTKKEETTVTIATDMTLYVAGEFEIKDAKLSIQDNHELTVYAGGGIELDPKDNSYINNVSKNPLNLIVYGLDTCTKVTIGKHEGFYGAIYAPNASIDVGDVDIYGSIVGDTIKIANNASIHYDEASASGDSGSLVCKNWKEL